MLHELDAAPPSPSVARLRWLCTFAEATGLRAAEPLAAPDGIWFASRAAGAYACSQMQFLPGRVSPFVLKQLQKTKGSAEGFVSTGQSVRADVGLYVAGQGGLGAHFRMSTLRPSRNWRSRIILTLSVAKTP